MINYKCMWLIVLQRTLLEFFWHILFFPIWWYSFGAFSAARVSFHVFLSGNYSLAPLLWFRNLFVPMYGLMDWQGRMISFFVRLINAIVRGVLLFGWAVCCLALFLTWFLVPIGVVFMLLRSFRV